MRTLEKIRNMLMDELKQCAESNSLTNSALDTVDKLTHAVKSIDTILAMEDAGYSRDSRSYAPERRGYAHHDAYKEHSRDDAKADLVAQLRDMSNGVDGESKMMLDEWIRQIENR